MGSREGPGAAGCGAGEEGASKEHGDQAGVLEPRGRKVMREEA